VINQNLKRLLAVTLFVVAWVGIVQADVEKSADATAVEVKISTDLYQDAQLAKQKRVPIVVMFSQDGCTYCGIVREQFLKPMLRSGDYKNKAIIREVKIDSFDDVRDFDGKLVPSDELSTTYRAYLTPTVVVFDSNGKAYHRILGITNEYFYGGELDDAIDSTYSQIHRIAVND